MIVQEEERNDRHMGLFSFSAILGRAVSHRAEVGDELSTVDIIGGSHR